MSIFRLGINRCLTLTQPFSSISRVRKQRQCPDFSMSGVRCPLRTLSLASLPFVCLTLCPITSHSPCQSALAGDLALKRDASGEGSGGREGDRTGWGLPHTQGSRRWRGQQRARRLLGIGLTSSEVPTKSRSSVRLPAWTS